MIEHDLRTASNGTVSCHRCGLVLTPLEATGKMTAPPCGGPRPSYGSSIFGDPLLIEHMRRHNILLELVLRESAEARERDVAWLASLSPRRRALELARRSLRARKRRAARLLEEYVTFRFARRRPNEDDW